MKTKKDALAAPLPSGKPRTHGGYSFLTTGKLPEHRRVVLAYLSAARAGLIKDLGPTEQDLTAAQIILIDRTVTALGIVRCIEEYIRENSVMKGSDLAPALRASYLAYCGHVRLNLVALGINKKQAGKVLDLGRYLAEKSRAPARKASPKAQRGQAEAGAIPDQMTGDDKSVDPRASGGDISGQAQEGIDCGAEGSQDQGREDGKIGQPEAPHDVQDRDSEVREWNQNRLGIETGHASATRMDELGPGDHVAGDDQGGQKEGL